MGFCVFSNFPWWCISGKDCMCYASSDLASATYRSKAMFLLVLCSFSHPCVSFQELSKPCSPTVLHLALRFCWLSVIHKSELFWKTKVRVWTERRGRFGLVCSNTRLFIIDCAPCPLIICWHLASTKKVKGKSYFLQILAFDCSY